MMQQRPVAATSLSCRAVTQPGYSIRNLPAGVYDCISAGKQCTVKGRHPTNLNNSCRWRSPRPTAATSCFSVVPTCPTANVSFTVSGCILSTLLRLSRVISVRQLAARHRTVGHSRQQGGTRRPPSLKHGYATLIAGRSLHLALRRRPGLARYSMSYTFCLPLGHFLGLLHRDNQWRAGGRKCLSPDICWSFSPQARLG